MTDQTLTDSEALFGGRTLTLQLIDGSTRTVFLRLIRVSEITTFLEKIATDEEAALRMVLSDPDLDFDSLTIESFDALLEANVAVNFTPALASSRAKLARAEKTGVGVVALLRDMASVSQSFAPTSPSPEDGLPPNSESSPSPGSSSSGGDSPTATAATPSPDSTPQG